MPSDTHRADERRFLDERGGTGPLAPNGLNPATILEKAVRERIIESYFWKEQCFGVNEADIVDRVAEHVTFVGGSYGGEGMQRPSPFLCLAFKLLQLAPGDDVLDVYLRHGGDRFKYLRALACFYVRLTRPADVVFRTLEPFLEDRRKLRRKGRKGTSLSFVDEFVDELLTRDRVCATSLWKMPSREILEDLDKLEPRVSPLGDIEDLLEDDEEDGGNGDDDDDDKNGDGRSHGSGEDERDVDMDDAASDRQRRKTNGVSGTGSGAEEEEEGEIESDHRRRRSRSRSSSYSDRSRRHSRERSYSREDRMDVDRDRRSDRNDSRERRRSRSRTRSRSRRRSHSR
ncbi:PRP38-domain-containing protein [Xylariaceae sp. FL0594]|nr:PRP38-domain-containing protein [Xylariaceae sp. FL0594]